MNKKAMFVISPLELLRWGILALYGLCMWFIYSGTKDYLSQTISLTASQSIAVGLVGILTLLFFLKFRGIMFRI